MNEDLRLLRQRKQCHSAIIETIGVMRKNRIATSTSFNRLNALNGRQNKSLRDRISNDDQVVLRNYRLMYLNFKMIKCCEIKIVLKNKQHRRVSLNIEPKNTIPHDNYIKKKTNE